MTTKKKILIGVGVFLAVIVLIVVVVLMATGKERSLAEKFVTDISNNRASTAYELFSNELKGVQDKPTFESGVADLGLDSSCKLNVDSVEASASTDEATKKEIKGRVKCDNKSFDAEFAFNDQSKLLGYSIQQ